MNLHIGESTGGALAAALGHAAARAAAFQTWQITEAVATSSSKSYIEALPDTA
jgi:hypothetical protein